MKPALLLFGFVMLLMPDAAVYAQNKPLSIGDSVPGFMLKDENDSVFNIEKYHGSKKVVIYFYPHDARLETVKWLCAFRDNMVGFKNAGAVVIAINNGTVEEHKNLYNKNKINFPLLSDPDKKVMNMFGFKGGLFSGQATYIMDESGQILFFLDRGSDHAQKALEYLRAAKR
jgi:peroxiredoxin Q/BCP